MKSCSLTIFCCIKNSVVIDPCCGSGGLLLKFAKILGKENVKTGFYGQEINLTTFNLARINMFLHDINYNKFNLAREDTLLKPAHWDDEPFDAIVSNPPYSVPWAGKSNPLLINDERFSPAGVLAPESKADLAFTMHMLSWLSPKGTAAIVEFPGVLYRGSSEKKIRKYMIDNNFIDTVIMLPSGLFFGASVPTCIIVLKKNKTDNNILLIDASKEYIPNKNKMKNGTNINILSNDNINNIYKLFEERKDFTNKSKLISYDDIVENEYDLSFNLYFEEEGTNKIVDINKINEEIKEIVSNQNNARNEYEKLLKELGV